MTTRPSTNQRPRTPARPLYAARLPPLQPLQNGSNPHAITSSASDSNLAALPQIPKLRPTTSKPAGTMLSATSTMGTTMKQSKPLPAIGDPQRRPLSSSKEPAKPIKTFCKFLLVVVFLSIPVLIFILMMLMSGGFQTTDNDTKLGQTFGYNGTEDFSTMKPLDLEEHKGGNGNMGVLVTTTMKIAIDSDSDENSNGESKEKDDHKDEDKGDKDKDKDKDKHDGDNKQHDDHNDREHKQHKRLIKSNR